MRHARLLVIALCAGALALSACTTGGSAAGGPGAASAAGGVFQLDAAGAKPLVITAKGGGVALRSADATAAVWVPPGAAASATWQVTPLTAAPEKAGRIIAPGFYVDTKGAKLTQPCRVAFAVDGTPTPGATIVRYKDDGSGVDVVPTTRVPLGGMTILVAYVDGFSGYGLGEQDQAAIDRAKARGKQVDWTIKVVGDETQNAEGWKFTYELDMFASGGGVAQGGLYKGHANLSVDGTYTGPKIPGWKAFGTVKGSVRDDDMSFFIIDDPLTDLVTGQPVGEPLMSGMGFIKGKGLGSIDIGASARNVSGRYTKNNVKGDTPVTFDIRIEGDDVEVEIAKVGIFPGKILRTEK